MVRGAVLAGIFWSFFMSASGAKNVVMIIVAVAALGGAALVAKQRGLIGGPSLDDRTLAVREKGDTFRQAVSRELNKQPERFNTVTIALQVEEDMKNPEKDARILVAGVVKEEADLDFIKQLVASKEPPLEVEWSVRVTPKQ